VSSNKHTMRDCVCALAASHCGAFLTLSPISGTITSILVSISQERKTRRRMEVRSRIIVPLRRAADAVAQRAALVGTGCISHLCGITVRSLVFAVGCTVVSIDIET
jgi:hypothetical protein